LRPDIVNLLAAGSEGKTCSGPTAEGARAMAARAASPPCWRMLEIPSLLPKSQQPAILTSASHVITSFALSCNTNAEMLPARQQPNRILQ